MKVIDITDRLPGLAGPAVCVSCRHEWNAATPVGTFEELECPSCGLTKGVFEYGVIPEPTWFCGCGCFLFAISGKSGDIMCWQCGEVQRGFD